MANSHLLQLTEGTFETEVLKSDVPVLVDFWAPWCQPCRPVSAAVEELSSEYAGKAKVGKVNIDEEMPLAQRYHVMSIPTVVVFKGGQVVDQQVGSVPKSHLEQMLQKVL